MNGHLSARMDRGLACEGGDSGSGYCLRTRGLWSTGVNKHLFIELLLCAWRCEGHKEALTWKTTHRNVSMRRSRPPGEPGSSQSP